MTPTFGMRGLQASQVVTLSSGNTATTSTTYFVDGLQQKRTDPRVVIKGSVGGLERNFSVENGRRGLKIGLGDMAIGRTVPETQAVSNDRRSCERSDEYLL